MIKPLTRSASVGSAFKQGLELYKANFWFLLAATLVTGLIGIFTCGICAGPMQCGLIGITLALLRRQEPKPEFENLFDGFQKFLPSFVSSLVLTSISIGLVMFLKLAFFLFGLLLSSSAFEYVPAAVTVTLKIITVLVQIIVVNCLSVIGSSMTTWALFLVQDQNATISEAIIEPFKLLGNKWFWSVILVEFVATLLAYIGILACCIGAIFTAPIVVCMVAVAYEEVHGKPDELLEVPCGPAPDQFAQ